ncbi:MAG: hypothetical protein FWB83_00670 [Treponema sp.]|nr:hypothetical protein [Treponema sp.]
MAFTRKKTGLITLTALLPVLIIFFNSCIGASIDIEMNRNGSGKLTIEYRVSRTAESIGRLDGNEGRPIIPTGRTDWERTVSRIDGLRMASFSSRENPPDIVYNIALEYDNPQALLRCLDPSGRSYIRTENNASRLCLIFNESVPEELNGDLLSLARSVSDGYNFSITFRTDRNSTLSITDGHGNPASVPRSAEITSPGRRVSMSLNVMDFITAAGGIGVMFEW